AVVNLRKPITRFLDCVVATEQAVRHPIRIGKVTAGNVKVSDRQLAEYLLQQVIQIRAVRQRVKIRNVLLSCRLEVRSVIIRIVEKVPLDSKRLAIHLLPFRRRIHIDLDVGGLQHIRRTRSTRRAWLSKRSPPTPKPPPPHPLHPLLPTPPHPPP